MTRAGLRGRLLKLEGAARLRAEALDPIVIWWADTDAGLWREGVGRGGEEGQTMPLDPQDAAEIRAEGGYRLMLTGLPKRGRA